MNFNPLSGIDFPKSLPYPYLIMIDSLKRTLYAGLGATVLTAEKLESVLQDLVDRGKLSAEDARETVRKVSEESKQEYQSARQSFQQSVEEAVSQVPLVRKKDLQPLVDRLDAIEQQLAAQNDPKDS